MNQYCCSIDLGTSSAKLVLVDEAGRTADSVTVDYRLDSPHPGWVESSPQDWLTAIERGIAELTTRTHGRIVAVGLDGQMHGLVVGSASKALRPAMLWPDSRAVDEVSAWQELPAEMRAPLANPLAPGMFAPMLAWLAHHEPEVLAEADFACLPKDWVRSQLATGGTVTDFSDASATLGWDVPGHRWHTALLESVGVPAHLLPQVTDSCDPVATTGRAGLPESLPVSVGCGDTAATLLATQLQPGEALVSVGTGIQVCMDDAEPLPRLDPRCHTFAGAGGGWYSMVAPQNGGLALGQVRALLDAGWDELYGSLDHPSDSSVRFFPWFAPDRLPSFRAGGNAGWQGLGMETRRSDLLRAAVESVAFQVHRAIIALPSTPSHIRLAGGGTRDVRMQQLICDVTGLPGRRTTVADTTALGAALLGWRAAGRNPNWPVPRQDQELQPRHDPALKQRRDHFVDQ